MKFLKVILSLLLGSSTGILLTTIFHVFFMLELFSNMGGGMIAMFFDVMVEGKDVQDTGAGLLSNYFFRTLIINFLIMLTNSFFAYAGALVAMKITSGYYRTIALIVGGVIGLFQLILNSLSVFILGGIGASILSILVANRVGKRYALRSIVNN